MANEQPVQPNQDFYNANVKIRDLEEKQKTLEAGLQAKETERKNLQERLAHLPELMEAQAVQTRAEFEKGALVLRARLTQLEAQLAREREETRRHLQEGLAFNPGYAPFAVALARIHVDRGEFAVALKVLEQAAAAGRGNPDYHALHGAVLQRLGRHGPAADAYRLALGSAPQSGATWVGLAISLEAQGHRPEAAEAYRRGLASGTLADEVRAYADQRARQLQ